MKANSQSNYGIGRWLKWGAPLLLVAVALGVWFSGWGRHHHRLKLTPEQELSAFAARLQSSKAPNHKEIADLLSSKSQAVLDTTLADEEKIYFAHQIHLEHEMRGKEPREPEPARNRPSARTGKVVCYRAGCMSEVVFSDHAYASAIQEHLFINPDAQFRKWPGTAYFGPLVPAPEGRIKTIWALLIQPHKIDELRGAIASADEGSRRSQEAANDNAQRPSSVVANEKGEN